MIIFYGISYSRSKADLYVYGQVNIFGKFKKNIGSKVIVDSRGKFFDDQLVLRPLSKLNIDADIYINLYSARF